MSPVFRHGGLRLYLLKLLDEAPRHGYDVIRLLQDRFLGVYSPSPGTIYPRLARLEEEGLVTHEVIDGKKVYKITDAGREELNRRFDDLADLEDELTASVRDIAREITRDVRETVRSLRDEFTWAVREAGRAGHETGRREPPRTAHATAGAEQAQPTADQARADADEAQAQAGAAGLADVGADGAPADDDSVWSKAAGESAGGERPAGDEGDRARAASGAAEEPTARDRQQPPWSGGWRDWADWAEGRDWREWAAWAEQQDWRQWAGRQEWKDRAKASQKEWKEWAKAGKQEWKADARGPRDAERDLIVDLERLAAAFAREIRSVAWQAEALSEDAVGNLGRILTDALNRIRTEVFRPPGSGKEE